MRTFIQAAAMLTLIIGGSALTLWLLAINIPLAWMALIATAATTLCGIAVITRKA
ncbi:hypothetical protein ACWEPC_01955 [Nonomuraea sp. NPDC004297]